MGGCETGASATRTCFFSSDIAEHVFFNTGHSDKLEVETTSGSSMRFCFEVVCEITPLERIEFQYGDFLKKKHWLFFCEVSAWHVVTQYCFVVRGGAHGNFGLPPMHARE